MAMCELALWQGGFCFSNIFRKSLAIKTEHCHWIASDKPTWFQNKGFKSICYIKKQWEEHQANPVSYTSHELSSGALFLPWWSSWWGRLCYGLWELFQTAGYGPLRPWPSDPPAGPQARKRHRWSPLVHRPCSPHPEPRSSHRPCNGRRRKRRRVYQNCKRNFLNNLTADQKMTSFLSFEDIFCCFISQFTKVLLDCGLLSHTGPNLWRHHSYFNKIRRIYFTFSVYLIEKMMK